MLKKVLKFLVYGGLVGVLLGLVYLGISVTLAPTVSDKTAELIRETNSLNSEYDAFMGRNKASRNKKSADKNVNVEEIKRIMSLVESIKAFHKKSISETQIVEFVKQSKDLYDQTAKAYHLYAFSIIFQNPLNHSKIQFAAKTLESVFQDYADCIALVMIPIQSISTHTFVEVSKLAKYGDVIHDWATKKPLSFRLLIRTKGLEGFVQNSEVLDQWFESVAKLLDEVSLSAFGRMKAQFAHGIQKEELLDFKDILHANLEALVKNANTSPQTLKKIIEMVEVSGRDQSDSSFEGFYLNSYILRNPNTPVPYLMQYYDEIVQNYDTATDTPRDEKGGDEKEIGYRDGIIAESLARNPSMNQEAIRKLYGILNRYMKNDNYLYSFLVNSNTPIELLEEITTQFLALENRDSLNLIRYALKNNNYPAHLLKKLKEFVTSKRFDSRWSNADQAIIEKARTHFIKQLDQALEMQK